MKHALIVLAIIGLKDILQAQEVIIQSLKQGETYPWSDVTERSLRWDKKKGQLYVRVTFSNHHYVSDSEPRVNDTFWFPLPGVSYDAATMTFFAEAPNGLKVPVAVKKQKLFFGWIQPAPGAAIQVLNKSGRAQVILTAKVGPQAKGMRHWILEVQWC